MLEEVRDWPCADTRTEQDWGWGKKKKRDTEAGGKSCPSRHGSRYNTEGTVAREGVKKKKKDPATWQPACSACVLSGAVPRTANSLSRYHMHVFAHSEF